MTSDADRVGVTRGSAAPMPVQVPARPKHRLLILSVGLTAALLTASLYVLTRGEPPQSVWGVIDILRGGGDRLARITVLEVRLPRLVLGVLVGAMLAAAGVVLQDSLRNALASPDLLGVTSGAAIVVAAIVVFGLPLPLVTQPWLALAGGLMAGFVVIASTHRSPDPVRVILIGAALSALLGTGVQRAAEPAEAR